MNNQHSIQSIGPPPQRHADRVVGEMMRDLARKHADMWLIIREAIENSADGNPHAQRRMEERVKRAGALKTYLSPGKRGRYSLVFYDITGWDEQRGGEIRLGDAIPARPWIACNITHIKSLGGGRDRLKIKSFPFVLITHHAIRRAAQRMGMRTSEDMLKTTRVIWTAALRAFNDRGTDLFNAPPQGWRVPLDEIADSFVVLKKWGHEDSDKPRGPLVAATVMWNWDKEE